MDVRKICIVCGNENLSRSPRFCCEKCEQHYYYEQNKEKRAQYKKEYYQNNKELCDTNHNNWVKNNKEKYNEYQKLKKRIYTARKREEENKNGL